MSPWAQSRDMRRLQEVRTQKQSRVVAQARELVVAAEQALAQARRGLDEARAQEDQARAAVRAAQRQSPGGASPLQILSLIEHIELAQHRHQQAQHQYTEMQKRLDATSAQLLAAQKGWRLQEQREVRWAERCARLLSELQAQREDAEEEGLEEDLSARLGRLAGA